VRRPLAACRCPGCTSHEVDLGRRIATALEERGSDDEDIRPEGTHGAGRVPVHAAIDMAAELPEPQRPAGVGDLVASSARKR
jgi:hypothetical protein